MASLTINNLDPDLNAQLTVQAAEHGRSVEEEARAILKENVRSTKPASPDEPHIYYKIRALVEKNGGGYDIELPSRKSIRQPFEFDP